MDRDPWDCIRDALGRLSLGEEPLTENEVDELAIALFSLHNERRKQGDNSTIEIFLQLPDELRERLLRRFREMKLELGGWEQEYSHLKRARERGRQPDADSADEE